MHKMMVSPNPETAAPYPCGTPAVVNGREIAVGVAGQYVEVAYPDGLALLEQGWTTNCEGGCGPTADRPAGLLYATEDEAEPRRYFDTDLGMLIVWDRQQWRNPATGASV